MAEKPILGCIGQGPQVFVARCLVARVGYTRWKQIYTGKGMLSSVRVRHPLRNKLRIPFVDDLPSDTPSQTVTACIVTDVHNFSRLA
jgi:hypothetical protein